MTGVPITVRDVSMTYRTRDREVEVLRDFSLHVDAGEQVAVVGPSGAGKTTLLALIGGLERVQSGTITVGAIELSELRGDALARYRHRTVGFVFQHFGLLGTLTAAENVELAMSFSPGSAHARRRRAEELLDAVGIAARARHRPSELSGGEAQRVALARALANQPNLLLADEPTGNLDGTTADQVLDLLDAVARDQGCTVVTVTHDPRVAERAHRLITLTTEVTPRAGTTSDTAGGTGPERPATQSHEREAEGEGRTPPSRAGATPEPGPERPATQSHEREPK